MPGYFRTVRMNLLEGRPFDATDRSSARPVVIVNEAFDRRFFSDRPALGARIRMAAGDGDELVEREIVGVVSDARYYRVREEPPEMMFLPALQAKDYLQSVDILTETGIALSAAEIRRVLAEMEPRLPVRRVSTLTDRVEENLAQEAMLARLTGFFGAFALILASIGLYGVMSYVVSRRTNEIGIRLALGAERGQVVRRMLGESLVLLALGCGIGLAASLAAGRWIESLLYGTRATDPGIMGLAVGVLVVVTLSAAYLPARRASRIEPSAALRYE